MITKEKSGRFKKFERTIHPKNGIIPPLSAYVKLWINCFNGQKTQLKAAQDCFYGRKHVLDRKVDLLTGRVAFSTKKNVEQTGISP